MRRLLPLCFIFLSAAVFAYADTTPPPLSAHPDTGLVKTMLEVSLAHFERLADQTNFPSRPQTQVVNGIKAWSGYGATSLMLAKRFPTRLKRSGIVSISANAIVESPGLSGCVFTFWDDKSFKRPCGASLSLVYADGSHTYAVFRRGKTLLSSDTSTSQPGWTRIVPPNYTELIVVNPDDVRRQQ